MSAASDFLEGEIIKHLFRTATWAKPTVLAVALCTAATSDSQTGATITEVANANGYARVSLNPLDANWTAPGVGGLTDNALAIVFPVATGAGWGTVTHFAICDSATWGAGNVWIHGALTASKTVGAGDTFQFAIGALDVTVA